MGVLDANPPLPEFRDDYVLQEVDRDWLSKAVKPKQFIHIDQSECIMYFKKKVSGFVIKCTD